MRRKGGERGSPKRKEGAASYVGTVPHPIATLSPRFQSKPLYRRLITLVSSDHTVRSTEEHTEHAGVGGFINV